MDSLKIFSKSGRRLRDEEERVREMNRQVEEAAQGYLKGFPQGFVRDVAGIFDSDARLVNKAAKAKLKKEARDIHNKVYGK